ncbi:hypothetical protein TNCV_335501 [Trichonephila clavipes]|nr:hypothetical protein TNCV_335501 [Trichonephila clavipes]
MILIGNVIYSTGKKTIPKKNDLANSNYSYTILTASSNQMQGSTILLQFAAARLMTQWNGICYTRSGSSGSTSEAGYRRESSCPQHYYTSK